MRAPVVPSSGRLTPLGLSEVSITGGFWSDRGAAPVIEHCREWTSRAGWVANFTDFADAGRVFADSEIYKLLEAMAWADHDGFGSLASVVVGAQEADGYLHTKFGRNGQAPRYSDLEWGHELYCAGHLIQAAVARLRSGISDAFTEAAVKLADHVCAVFEKQGYCGHPEIEMALVELYRVTGAPRYLEQARLFVERRGSGQLGPIEFGPTYFQDDVPLRSRKAFSGHAVRELYLACGAVDVAVETGDHALLALVIGQWERTVAARTYLTGGMGSRHEGESFGEDFELPPDGAYSETCAGIASVMLAWRLLLATGEARFADLIERTLYNVVATSPAPDGKSFFYANPLQQRFPGTQPGMSSRAVTGLRAPWFEVSCCPTNLARTFASLPAYLSTADADGIQIHQYATSSIRSGLAELQVVTDYPWSGTIRVRVNSTTEQPWTLSLRVPPWAAGSATIRIEPRAEDAWAGGSAAIEPDAEHEPVVLGDLPAGYAEVHRAWRPGDEVMLSLDMSPRWTRADPRIDAVRGCAAIEYGPLVYCAEAPDGLGLISVLTDRPVSYRDGVITAAAVSLTAPASPWPYGEPVGSAKTPNAPVHQELALIPYHRWANRGPTTMRVWLPVSADVAVDNRSGNMNP